MSIKLIATNETDGSMLSFDDEKKTYVVTFYTDEGTKETIYGSRQTAIEAFFYYNLP